MGLFTPRSGERVIVTKEYTFFRALRVGEIIESEHYTSLYSATAEGMKHVPSEWVGKTITPSHVICFEKLSYHAQYTEITP